MPISGHNSRSKAGRGSHAAVTHYAAVFHDDPHGTITEGLRFWKAPYSVDRKYAESVWNVVAEVTGTGKE